MPIHIYNKTYENATDLPQAAPVYVRQIDTSSGTNLSLEDANGRTIKRISSVLYLYNGRVYTQGAIEAALGGLNIEELLQKQEEGQ